MNKIFYLIILGVFMIACAERPVHHAEESPEPNLIEDQAKKDSRDGVNQNVRVDLIFPLKEYRMTRGLGWKRKRFHKGLDLVAPRGTPIMAMDKGTVIFSGRAKGYGNLVIVDHGNGLKSFYAHNSNNIAKKGTTIDRGQIIAHVGRTGRATCSHLHFEIRSNDQVVNPLDYFPENAGNLAKEKSAAPKG